MTARRSESTTLFFNGRILTMSSRARASAMIVEAGRIAEIGSLTDLRRAAPRGAERIDLKDRFVVPGFNDCHTHFVQMGVDSMSIDLARTRTMMEALELIKKGASRSKGDNWVVATGWRESAWPDGRFISRSDLDDCCRALPMVAYRICGHLCSVNTRAMSELGIDERTPDAELDSGGRPTGVLTESAVEACRKATETDAATRLKGIVRATRKAYRLGVTSVTDNGSTQDLAAYMTAKRSGRLNIRVSFNIPSANLDSLLDSSISTGLGDSWLRLGGVKVFCDGALGARSAALSRPYADDPSNSGMFVHKREDLDSLTARANEAGIQLAIHAIGDMGIDAAISTISQALRGNPRRDHRHRIEHLELPTRAHLQAMRRLGILASMQPNFIGEWGGTEGMYVSRLGPVRTSRNNPFREVLDEGVTLAFGSDCMPFHPMYGMSSAVNAPFPSQRIAPLEALAAYTRDAAFTSFEERDKGTLEKGKLADFAVLSGDILDPGISPNVTVLMTVLGGDVVHSTPAMQLS